MQTNVWESATNWTKYEPTLSKFSEEQKKVIVQQLLQLEDQKQLMAFVRNTITTNQASEQSIIKIIEASNGNSSILNELRVRISTWAAQPYVDHTPYDREVVGLNPTSGGLFSLIDPILSQPSPYSGTAGGATILFFH